MTGWHHQYSGREPGQTLGDSVGEGGLVCSSPWVVKNRTQLGN